MAGPFAPIPMPQNGMDAFMSGMQNSQSMFDSMMKNRMTPYQIKLLEAQAQEAQGKAKAEGMAGDYIQSLMHPGSRTTSSPEEPLTGTQTPGGFDNTGNQTTYNTATTPIYKAPPEEAQPNKSGIAPNPLVNPKALAAANNLSGAPENNSNVPAPAPMPNSGAKLPNIGEEKTIFAGDPSKYQQDEAAKQGLEMNIGGISVKPKIEEKTENGWTIKTYPSSRKTIQKVGETGEEKGQREVGEKKQEAENAADIEVTKDFSKENVKSYQAGQIAKNDVAALKETMDHPRYKNIAGTGEGMAMNANVMGFPVGMAAQKFFPKEDQDLLGTANAQMGNVVLHVGQQFKGPFKQLINGLINGMKPNINDPLPIQKGKLRALETAIELGQQQTALYDSYQKQGLSPIKAMEATSKALPYSKIKKEITDAQKAEDSTGNMVSVRDNHTGKVTKMTREEYDNLVKG